MDLSFILLRSVQLTAVLTFLVFLFFVFIPKLVLRKNSFKSFFFNNKSVSKDFLILSANYVFLFAHLFIFVEITYFPIFVFGVVCALTGLIVSLIGRLQLRKLWNPLTNIYNSRKLLKTGVFAYIRHPIYFGRFMFFIGILTK